MAGSLWPLPFSGRWRQPCSFLLRPCKSSCPASLQHRLLPAVWFCPSMFWVLAHPTSMGDCPPAELTSGALVGPYVPAAAPGDSWDEGDRPFPWGWCLMGKRRNCAHTILRLLDWKSSCGIAPSKCGLGAIFIAEPLNCPKPLYQCAILCP